MVWLVLTMVSSACKYSDSHLVRFSAYIVCRQVGVSLQKTSSQILQKLLTYFHNCTQLFETDFQLQRTTTSQLCTNFHNCKELLPNYFKIQNAHNCNSQIFTIAKNCSKLICSCKKQLLHNCAQLHTNFYKC